MTGTSQVAAPAMAKAASPEPAELLAPGMMPEPEFEKPQPIRQLPALRSVGAAQTRALKGTTKKLAAMLAAQGSVAPPASVANEGLAEVLQDQPNHSSASWLQKARSAARVAI